MSLYQDARSRSSRRLQPLGAVAVSLAAVLGWTVLLGVGFLPQEVRKLTEVRGGDCILRHHRLADGRQIILRRRRQGGGLLGQFVREVVLVGPRPESAQRVLLPAHVTPLATAVSGDGGLLFVRDLDGQVFAIDLKSSHLKPVCLVSNLDEGWGDLDCSLSDEVLVAGGRSGLCAWDTENRAQRWSRPDLDVASWDLGQPGDRLLVNTTEGALLDLDLLTGQTLQVIATFNDAARSVASSPDHAKIARIGPGGQLELLDRACGKPMWPPVNPPRRASFGSRVVAFSPCGRVLVTGDAIDFNCLLVWNVATGQRLGELRSHTDPVMGLAFDPDGSLRSWGLDGKVCTWKSPADDPEGSTPRVQTFELDRGKPNWRSPNLSAAVVALP